MNELSVSTSKDKVHTGRSLKIDSEINGSFSLMWNDLSYCYPVASRQSRVSCFIKDKCDQKQVIKSMDGCFTCGSLNGILGPSGAGKSTLLNCLTGRLKVNVTGRSYLRSHVNSLNIRIGYVEQVDSLFEHFTVGETITFACRLNNSCDKWYENEIQIKCIIDTLGLNDVIDCPINKISGGERKRTSIAVELISQPLILALDEPTSGLDADNCDKLIMMLKKLSKTFTSPLTNICPLIMLTIHSPSYNIFCQFDSVYLLSRQGHNLYQGAPRSITTHFSQFYQSNVRGNPAEHIIDIANGKYGLDKFDEMATCARGMVNVEPPDERDRTISSLSVNCDANSATQIALLVKRSLIYYIIKVPQAFVRMFEHIFVFFFLTFALITPIAVDPLCSVTSTSLNESLTADEYLHQITYKLSLMDKIANFVSIGAYAGIILIDATFISSIVAVLLMTYHWPVHRREINNSWYTLSSFFIAKCTTDLIVRSVCIAPAAFLFFIRSSVPLDLDRIVLFILIILIDASIWENLSAVITILTGCKRSKLLDTIVNVFVYQMADFVFIDIVLPANNLSRISHFLKGISPQANIYSAVIVLLFGLKRCAPITGQVTTIDLTLGKPLDLVSQVWHQSNITANDLTRKAAVLYVDKNFAHQVYDEVARWLTQFKEKPTTNESFVLAAMGHQDNLYRQFLVASAWLVASYALFYWTLIKLHRRTNS